MHSLSPTFSNDTPGVATACVTALAAMAVLEVAAKAGWPLPLPTSWSLLAVLVASRFGGLPGGMWAASMMLGYAVYTAGFTTGHAAGLQVWGGTAARVLAFGLAAPLLVVLAQRPYLVSETVLRERFFAWFAQREPSTARTAVPELDRSAAQRTFCETTKRAAHDINNQLTVILALAELHEQEQRGGGDPEHSEAPPAVANAVERCYAITQQLLETCADYQARLPGSAATR